MSKACCEHHHKNLTDLRNRALGLLILGCILLVPIFEDILTSGIPGHIFFACTSLLIAHCIHQDFPEEKRFSIGALLSVCLALAAPATQIFHYLSFIHPSYLIAQCILSCCTLLFLNWRNFTQHIQSFTPYSQKNSKYEKKATPILQFPSINKVMLLFVIVSWSMSCASLIPALSSIYSNVLHDALLVLGISNISAWIKQQMQTAPLSHNHQIQVTIIHPKDNKKTRRINLTELKKGMQIRIESHILIPISCKAIHSCIATHDSSETRFQVPYQEPIQPNTMLHSGVVECLEDYSTTDQTHNKTTEESDPRLAKFLMISLIIAVASGLWHGIVLNSFAIGLQFFCINLIVSCPCIFLLAKPIIHGKFLHWLNVKSHVKFSKMPSIGKPNILVFDRTHTLYEENPQNPSGDYIISHKTKRLLKSLKKSGIECYILSGHGTKNWENHLKDCRTELDGIVKAENIIFDKKYHNNLKAKKTIIENLQIYGTVKKPETLLQSIYQKCKNMFIRNHVGMVGDGENDIYAMKQADLTVGISRISNNYHNHVLKESNFCVEQSNLWHVDRLLNTLNTTQWYYNVCIYSALAYNLTMLTMVNGLYHSLFGMAITPATACLGVSIFCISLLSIASFIKIDTHNSPLLKKASTSKCCNESNKNHNKNTFKELRAKKPIEDNKVTHPNETAIAPNCCSNPICSSRLCGIFIPKNSNFPNTNVNRSVKNKSSNHSSVQPLEDGTEEVLCLNSN